MVDNRLVNIGNITFNAADIKKSEVVVKDGQEINSVFLNDGTHLEFPTQSENNNSQVSQRDYTYNKPVIKYGYNLRSGEFEHHLSHEEVVDPSRKVTDFSNIYGVKVTGTPNEDRYNMTRCVDSEIDVSQNDGQKDDIVVRKNKNTKVKLAQGDVVNHDKGFFGGYAHGPGNYDIGK